MTCYANEPIRERQKTEIDELQFRGDLSPKKSTQRKLRALQIG